MRRWRKSIRTVSARMISKYAELDNDKVVLLNYTSGTTGFSKGVMLTGNNLAGNVMYGIDLGVLYRGGNANSVFCRWHMLIVVLSTSLVPMAVGAPCLPVGEGSFSQNPVESLRGGETEPDPDGPLILEKIYKNDPAAA